jgi:inner membrane protein
VPALFSHPAVPLALGTGLGAEVVPRRLLLAAARVSALADLDVVTVHWGIPYSAGLGHRGFVFLFVAAASHGALDACTNGGLGVAFLWPWSEQRFFAPEPLRVIEVSPIGLGPFLSARGAAVLESEVRWIWLPALAVGLILVGARRARSRRRRGGHA